MDFHLSIAARTLWQEARGEPIEGQKAVAAVLANRLRSGHWGSTLGEVCLAESEKGTHQFSGWNWSDPNRKLAFALADTDPVLVALAGLVHDAVNGAVDPTGGAINYYATSMANPPYWAVKTPGKPEPIFCGQFGHQRFYKFGPLVPAS